MNKGATADSAPETADASVSVWLGRAVTACAAAVTVLGSVVLVGWFTETDLLLSVLPNLVAMQFNTALGFVLCGAGLLALRFGYRKSGLAGGAPPVDLGQLIKLLGSNDEIMLKQTLDFFWSTIAETPGQLRIEIDNRNVEAVRYVAHSTKGASASAGATALADLMTKIQIAAEEEDWVKIEELRPAVERAFNDVKTYIETLPALEAD
jgi:HPt (histidine-containing phosphotransfer) domain-containing protein